MSSAVIPVLRKALWRRLQTRLLSTDGPLASGLHQEVLAQLVPFARAKDLAVLMDHLPGLLQTPGRHERYEGLRSPPLSTFPCSFYKLVESCHPAVVPVSEKAPPSSSHPAWSEHVSVSGWLGLVP